MLGLGRGDLRRVAWRSHQLRVPLDREGSAREAVMVGFRQCQGISLSRFKDRYGIDLPTLAGPEFDKLVADGLLEVSDGHVRLTREGRCVANRVIVEFMG